MNHKYTSLLLALTTVAAHAQRVSTAHLPAWAQPERFVKTDAPVKPGSEGVAKAAGDVVFYEDFANGLAGNNGLGAWTVDGTDGDIWKYTTTGPDGGYSTNAQAIASTTESNGWMIFDCDRSNSDTTGSTPEPLPVDEFQSRDGYLVSPLMDLSATPYVHIEFEMRGRWCCSTFPVIFVDVSTNGGATWPTRLEAAQPLQFANDDPGTYTRYINLHNGIAANPANVKIRFSWEGSSQTNGMSHYFWQVDDVKVIESDVNDVDAKNPSYNLYLPGTITESAEFNIVPISQVSELDMGSPVANEGSAVATNVVLAAEVIRDGSTVFTGEASQASLAQGVLDSSFVINYTPDAIGAYTLNLNLTSDSVDAIPSNNTGTKSWEVSDFVYAQDEGARDGVISDAPNNTTGEYLSCNFFWMENDATVYALQVALAGGSGNSQVGGEFDMTLLDQDLAELGTTPLAEILATNQLSGNGQAKFFTLQFDSPLEIVGQQEVCACVHYYGGGSRVVTASSGASIIGESLFMRANEDGQRFLEFQTPMVRMNFNPNVGIEEGDIQNGVGMGQNFPNPSRGTTVIPYSLTSGSNVSLELHDLSGKLVRTLQVGQRAAGSHRLEVSTFDMNEGVYFYSLIADGVRLTKRMTVLH